MRHLFIQRRERPTLYPVACAPQSWASASVFLILQSSIGLLIKADQSKIYFYYPLLPEFLQTVRIKKLRVGDASVDIELQRHEQDVGINIMGREGDIEVVVVK
ncbi:MAG: hypothetical protein ACE5EA_10510 [Nitrospirota bacterium]